MRSVDQTRGEKRNVEAMLARTEIACLLGRRQQIEKQRGDAGAVKPRGDPDVARALAAAAAAMGKQHDTFCACGNRQVSRQRCFGGWIRTSRLTWSATWFMSVAPVIEQKRLHVAGRNKRTDGGAPVAFDRVLGSRFGVAAIDAASSGKFGMMTALKGTAIEMVALEDALKEPKLLDPELFATAEVFFG